MHAIVVIQPGDPDVLTWTEVPDPVPGPGEVLVDIAASGVVVSALYTRAATPYLRMYEHRGLPDSVVLGCKNRPGKFTETDLRGNAIGAADFPLRFAPWQIRNWRSIFRC